jgi:hypothetical protein
VAVVAVVTAVTAVTVSAQMMNVQSKMFRVSNFSQPFTTQLFQTIRLTPVQWGRVFPQMVM